MAKMISQISDTEGIYSLAEVSKALCDSFSYEDDVLREIRSSMPNGKEAIQLSPNEAKILSLLVSIKSPSSILEIGTGVGYSAAWMARTAPKSSTITTIEKNVEHCKIARTNFRKAGIENKVTLYCGDAAKILHQLVDEKISFDMVFVDADKSSYPIYLKLAYTLMNTNGILAADNTISHYKSSEGIRVFNEDLRSNPGFQSAVIPTVSGMTLAQKLK